MGLAQVVATTPPAQPRTGTPCSVGRLLTVLDGDDLDALLEILYGEGRKPGGWGKPASEVYRLIDGARIHALTVKQDPVEAAKYVVSKQQINRHRSGACRCGA